MLYIQEQVPGHHNVSSFYDMPLPENKLRSDFRAPDKVPIFISIMPISSPNSMFDNLLESFHRDDSSKW